MRKFNNPLDNIRIASPCTANWDEMFGDQPIIVDDDVLTGRGT